MTLPPGARLGPYEILGQIGAGGMGEVYRARDPRLSREVAIKVLPASFSADADRLRRFEQEAKAAGVLNHPNITAVYDIGTDASNGAPYVVQELLEGETLRAILAGGKVSPRKAVDYALQTARGLAAAHEKGIVHRDLKPENLFITRDGRVKILDFGLAKLTQPEGAGSAVTSLPTETRGTEPGVVLGTLGYMSPEQVRGRPADARSDIFSFGAILYEMLSGNRAFRGDSAADTMSAILREDPPDLSVTNQSISPGLERIVRHCLEKNPEQRFHSAHDLAFDLEALSATSGQSVFGGIPALRRKRLPWFGVAASAAIALGAFALGHLWQPKGPSPIAFQRITYRRGLVDDARFAPDGQTVIYSAQWDGNPSEMFTFTPGSPESRALGLPGASLQAVSPTGELAVNLPRFEGGTQVGNTLARVPLGGGAPRPVIENASNADWSRDGKSLLVTHEEKGRVRLEFPVGKMLYDTSGSISYPRLSPQGDRIAFIDRPIFMRPQGRVVLLDLTGHAKVLSEGWKDIQGLAWRPDGNEIWFAATTRSEGRALHAVTLGGQTRLVARMPGSTWLLDISKDGRVLIDQWSVRNHIAALPPGETRERDLSWLDGSTLQDISADGKRILFSETSQGGGENSGVYVRATDGSPAVRLGEGTALCFSHDLKWVATTLPRAVSQLILLPIGPGQPRELPQGKINYEDGRLLPDDKSILFVGSEPGHGVRTYVQPLDGSALPRAFTPDGIWASAVSPDGSFVAAQSQAEPTPKLYPIAGGEPRAIPGIAAGELVYHYGADGRHLLIMVNEATPPFPRKVFRIDLASGKRELWRELAPADATGVSGCCALLVSADERSYAYSYSQGQSEMYIIEGLK
jgi:eukaryotic-like serine/threonine-protein kinase